MPLPTPGSAGGSPAWYAGSTSTGERAIASAARRYAFALNDVSPLRSSRSASSESRAAMRGFVSASVASAVPSAIVPSGGHDAIATQSLRAIERLVGALDEARDGDLARAGHGHADRDRDGLVDAKARRVQPHDRAPDALPDLDGLLGRCPPQEHRELLPTVAG